MINSSSTVSADSEAYLPGPSCDILVSSPLVDQPANYVETLEVSSTPEVHVDTLCSASVGDQPDDHY